MRQFFSVKHVNRLLPWIILILALFFFSRGFLTNRLKYSDFEPFTFVRGRSLSDFFFVWSRSYLGYYSLKPLVNILRGILEFLFGNALIAQGAYLLPVWFLGVSGVYKILIKKISASVSAAVFGGLLYFINPIHLAEITNGATGVMLVYSIIPWFLLFFDDLLIQKSRKKGIYFAFLLGGLLINLQTAFVVFCICFVHLLLFWQTNKGPVLPLLRRLFTLSIYVLLGTLMNIGVFASFMQVSSNFTKIDYAGDFRHNYTEVSALNILSLAFNNGSSQRFFGYFTDESIKLFSSFVALLVSASVVKLFGDRLPASSTRRRWIWTAVVTFFVSTFALYLISIGFFNEAINSKNIVLVMFRNPQKLSYAVSLSAVILVSTAISIVADRFSKKYDLKKIVVGVVICIIAFILQIAQSPQLLSGNFGRFHMLGESFIDSSSEEVISYFHKLEDKSAALVLPLTRSSQLTFGGDHKVVQFPLGKARDDSSGAPGSIKKIFSAICNPDWQHVFNSIQYIVIDKKAVAEERDETCRITSSYGTPYIFVGGSVVKGLVMGLESVFQNERYQVYRTGSQPALSVKVLASTSFYIESGSIEPSFKRLGLVESSLVIDQHQIIDGVRVIRGVFDAAATFPRSIHHRVSDRDSVYFDSRVRSWRAVKTVDGVRFESLEKGGVYLNGIERSYPEMRLQVKLKNVRESRLMIEQKGLISYLRNNQPVQVAPPAREVHVLLAKGPGYLLNPSFETGPWQPTVGDCNKFDNNPILGMSLNRQEKTDGRQSLQLEATRHTACVSTKIALPADTSGDYALSFDYQSPNGQKAGYYLQFDDEKKTVVRETPSIATSTWQSYAKKVSIPAGAKNARLYLYGYSLDEQTNVITRYDNVQFGKLELVKTIEIQQEEGYEKIPVTLKEGENTFEYVDPRYDYKNLLPNPSFETRPWQEKVGDCNRYDDTPQLAMRLNEQEKTDGAKSLELEATRHTACMATTVPIKPGATYLLSFDYQSPNAKQASYYIGFNDPEKTSLKDQLTVTSTAWNAFSSTFAAPKGATSLSLYVYARETDKKTAIINRYDNFKLIEVPDLRDAFYLVSEPERKLVEPKSVEFELINPTKKLVHIKGATTPFFLGMSESHHDQWQLQFQNEKIEGALKRWWPFAKPDRIADEYHYKLNGFLNAWYIDTDDWCATQGKCTKNADGSYDIDMVIEFWPQRWFYLGLLISGTTLAGCLGYLGYEGVRSVRRRLAARKKEAV